MTHPLVSFLEDALRPAVVSFTHDRFGEERAAGVVPVVEVRSCKDCPMARAGGYIHYGPSAGSPYVDCRLAGSLVISPSGNAPTGCPLRNGPVTLQLADRGRP